MSGLWRTGGYAGASPDDPGHERVDGSRAGMAHPPAAHARRGVAITGCPGVGEKRGGGRAGDSRSPRERPRRSATEPAPAGWHRSPPPPARVARSLSDPGQRTGTHGACSRCDGRMKDARPGRPRPISTRPPQVPHQGSNLAGSSRTNGAAHAEPGGRHASNICQDVPALRASLLPPLAPRVARTRGPPPAGRPPRPGRRQAGRYERAGRESRGRLTRTDHGHNGPGASLARPASLVSRPG